LLGLLRDPLQAYLIRNKRRSADIGIDRMKLCDRRTYYNLSRIPGSIGYDIYDYFCIRVRHDPSSS
jgi:hypothetical protein